MRYIKTIIVSLFLVLTLMPLRAQVFTQVNEIAAPISATGSSNMATAADAWALLVNQAGLSRLEWIEVVSGFYKPYGLSFYSSQIGILAVPVGKLGTVAIGYQGSSSDYSGNSLTSESSYSISHGFYLQKDIISTLSIGYTVNLYQIDYGQSAGTSGDGSDGINLGSGYGFGIDLGIQGSLHERSWIGLFAKNVNSPEMGSALSSSRLPRSLAVGFGYEPYYGLKTNFLIFQAIGGHKTQYRAGIEYRVMSWMIMRCGVNTEPNRIGFGFGINKWGLLIDYAFVSHPVLPETHQFSLGYSFKKR
ncbi:MAG TPA: hypothetical protein DHW42_08765 [Candidatus Marinimicrobia bacterium]|nr:hypothetical protein [Candidatus Neomarinimicrobiota bacterium]